MAASPQLPCRTPCPSSSIHSKSLLVPNHCSASESACTAFPAQNAFLKDIPAPRKVMVKTCCSHPRPSLPHPYLPGQAGRTSISSGGQWSCCQEAGHSFCRPHMLPHQPQPMKRCARRQRPQVRKWRQPGPPTGTWKTLAGQRGGSGDGRRLGGWAHPALVPLQSGLVRPGC